MTSEKNKDTLDVVDQEDCADPEKNGALTKEAAATLGSIASLNTPKPPDGGWGWVVVVGCMVGHVLIVGVARGFGIFYVALIEKFQMSAAATSLVPSLFNLFRMVGGPAISWLCDKYTVRKVVIIGGLIYSAGCVASAFASSLYFLIITFGVIAAIGAGCIFTPMFVILSQYFDKNKGKAMAFSTLGGGVGTVIMAQLITFLLAEYSFYGAMLITGGLVLNNCVVGAVFRPLRKKTPIVKPLPDLNGDVTESAPKSGFFAALKSRASLVTNVTFMLHCLCMMSMPFSLNLPLVFIPPLMREYAFTDHRTKAALLISAMSLSDMGGRFVFGFIFDIKAIRPWRRPLHSTLGILMGLSVALIAVSESFPYLVGLCIVWGFIESGFHSQRATIQSTFISKKQISNSVGFMILFQGIGNMTATMVGGIMTDALGSYKYSFLFGGCIMIFFCSLFQLEYIIRQILSRKEAKQNPTC